MQRPRDSRSTRPPARRATPAPGAAGPRTLLLVGGLLLLLAGGAVLASGVLDRGDGGAGPRDGAVAAAGGTAAGAADADAREGDRPAARAGRREASAPPVTRRPEGAPASSAGGTGELAPPAGGRVGSAEAAAADPATGAGSPGTPPAEGASPGGAPADPTAGGDAGDAGRAAPDAGQAAPDAGQAAPDVERLLARAEEAYSSLRSLRARFRQEIEVPLLERRREGQGVWLQKGRGRFKMDFTEPPEDVIVADGEYLWLYYPSTNPRQVIRSGLEAPQTRAGTADVLARILAEARTNYTATYAGTEPVTGVPTHVVRLRPVGRSPYREVTVWIGAEDHLVRRFRIVERNETVRTVTLADLRPDAPIPDSVFRFTPPPDADVFSG